MRTLHLRVRPLEKDGVTSPFLVEGEKGATRLKGVTQPSVVGPYTGMLHYYKNTHIPLGYFC